MMVNLDELRDRMKPDELSVLDHLVSSQRRVREMTSVRDIARNAKQSEEEVREILRMFSDLELVELRDGENQVRVRAAGILATRESNVQRNIQAKMGVVGDLWKQLGKGTRTLAKLATGLIGLAILGQVAMGLYYILWFGYAVFTWWSTGTFPAPGG